MHKFNEVAESSQFNFIGNITIGEDIPLAKLAEQYDCILFAYGASQERNLGIKGEDLDGVYSARSFVGWYNGLPEHRDVSPILEEAEDAVIIGHGNVALDVARILLSDPKQLATTDMATYAVEKLRKSRVKRVQIVGRRGPLQVSYLLPHSNFADKEGLLHHRGGSGVDEPASGSI